MPLSIMKNTFFRVALLLALLHFPAVGSDFVSAEVNKRMLRLEYTELEGGEGPRILKRMALIRSSEVVSINVEPVTKTHGEGEVKYMIRITTAEKKAGGKFKEYTIWNFETFEGAIKVADDISLLLD